MLYRTAGNQNTGLFFNGNKFFLSASCISIKGGISDIYHIDVIDVKNKMLQKSETSYLLVDSTKFGKISTTKWYELKDMDYIITDNNIPENELKKFNDSGIKITIAFFTPEVGAYLDDNYYGIQVYCFNTLYYR